VSSQGLGASIQRCPSGGDVVYEQHGSRWLQDGSKQALGLIKALLAAATYLTQVRATIKEWSIGECQMGGHRPGQPAGVVKAALT
jgi:hypothetical protein